MKAILLVSVLACLTLASYSQARKIVVNCWIIDGRVNYGHLGALLPDSIKANLLVDPRQRFNLRDVGDILLWLEQQGWKLMAVDAGTNGIKGNIYPNSIYILSKDIYLDDAARVLFLQKLESIENKK
jgi:hypothetical protein